MPFNFNILSMLLPFLSGMSAGGSVPTVGAAESQGVTAPSYDIPAATQPFNWGRALSQGGKQALMGGFMPGAGMTNSNPANPFGLLTQQSGYPMGIPGTGRGQGGSNWLAILLNSLMRR
jgi:hypothetical protein